MRSRRREASTVIIPSSEQPTVLLPRPGPPAPPPPAARARGFGLWQGVKVAGFTVVAAALTSAAIDAYADNSSSPPAPPNNDHSDSAPFSNGPTNQAPTNQPSAPGQLRLGWSTTEECVAASDGSPKAMGVLPQTLQVGCGAAIGAVKSGAEGSECAAVVLDTIAQSTSPYDAANAQTSGLGTDLCEGAVRGQSQS